MENKRKALGKGLEQLFNNETLDLENFEQNIHEATSNKDIREIKLSELRSNPYQPRINFDQEKLEELATSIIEYGVIEPIIIKKSIKGYEIIAGERRVKASILAKKETIPAIIKEFTDEEMMQIALLENIQREDLNPIEEAVSYNNIINSVGFTQEEFAKKIGKSRSYVTNMLGILKLPEDVKKNIMLSKISLGHAKILSKIDSALDVLNLSEQIVDKHLSVRALEDLVNNSGYKKINAIKVKKESKYKDIEQIMREHIGTMVKIKDKKIEIPYDSEKDLERILEILKINLER